MSMLTRKGTLVRKHRPSLSHGSLKSKRSSRPSTTSCASSASASSGRHSIVTEHSYVIIGQPRRTEYTKDEIDAHVSASPKRKVADTVVSFDDERRLVRTSLGWDYHPQADDLQQDYGAFMYQIREANKESENIVDFGCKTSYILCNTLFVTILIGVSLALPVAMVSIGIKYLDDCPKEPRIPVYLLVGGGFGLIKLLASFWKNIQVRRYQDMEVVFDDHDGDGAFGGNTFKTMDTLVFLFLFCWQIVGTYWTLNIWMPHFEQLLHEPSNWCDKNVYMFTVYQVSVVYGAMFLYILVLITLTCCVRCRK